MDRITGLRKLNEAKNIASSETRVNLETGEQAVIWTQMPDSVPIRSDTYLSVSVAAKKARCSPQQIRRLLKNGKLQGVKIGPVWLISVRAAREYIESAKLEGR